MCKINYNLATMQAEASIRRELEPANITVKSRVYDTNSDPLQITDLFVSSYDVMAFNATHVFTVLCTAN